MLYVTWRVQGSLHQKPYCASVAAVDRLLDRQSSEPQLLAESRYARIVKRTIQRYDGDLYYLRAWVVMHNHIHLLVDPTAGISLIARTIMDETESSARTTIWVRESYERIVAGEEAAIIAHRIENHPVIANLVSRSEDWEWSSAYSEGAGSSISAWHPTVRKRARRAA